MNITVFLINLNNKLVQVLRDFMQKLLLFLLPIVPLDFAGHFSKQTSKKNMSVRMTFIHAPNP